MGGLGENALVYGKCGAFVVGYQVGFLEESSAESILRIICCAFDWEVTGGVRDTRVVGREFEVETSIGEGDVYCF